MPSAQNMYIDWYFSGSSYDLAVNSFKCQVNSRATYWAVHQWSNGYAGFQNVSENNTEDNRIILAIWDDNTNLAAIEYYTNLADTSNFDFTELGESGKHIISAINWQDQTWYSMAVGVKSDNDFTYYFHWVKEELDTNEFWKLYGIIRLPVGCRTLNKSTVFQEDFDATNALREGWISHAFGRFASSGNWDSWSSGEVKSYNPNTGDWNTGTNCDCGTGTYADGEYVIMRTGNGAGTCSEPLPFQFQHEYQSGSPLYSPTFPCYIKSNYSSLYVSPDSTGTKVVQKASRHWWNFVDAGNGYVYILTTDRTKAITISGTTDGSDLTLTAFSGGTDSQKWKVENVSGVYYLYPKNAPSMNMDIEGPSYQPDADIQIWTHNTSTLQFKWTIV